MVIVNTRSRCAISCWPRWSGLLSCSVAVRAYSIRFESKRQLNSWQHFTTALSSKQGERRTATKPNPLRVCAAQTDTRAPKSDIQKPFTSVTPPPPLLIVCSPAVISHPPLPHQAGRKGGLPTGERGFTRRKGGARSQGPWDPGVPPRPSAGASSGRLRHDPPGGSGKARGFGERPVAHPLTVTPQLSAAFLRTSNPPPET